MKILKKNNRHYGQYFEQAVEAVINGESILNHTEFDFPLDHIEAMDNHAKKLSEYLSAERAKRVGEKTSLESCDLVVDGDEVEIKYVGSGTGTYFNTSMEYVSSLGMKSFKEYLLEAGYTSALKDVFGDLVSLDNLSPVSNESSSYIRHNFKEEYKRFSKWEKEIREEYVKDFYDFLIANGEARVKFTSDLVSKSASGKHIPDRLIVFNHNTEQIFEFSKKELEDLGEHGSISVKGVSIKFGCVRATFGWQNGTGLNNPTIRVFI